MRLVFDIETDGLHPSVIWCICAKDADTGEEFVWRYDEDPLFRGFKEKVKEVDTFIAHNGLGYDVPNVNRLLGYTIDPEKVIDTFVLSRLTNFNGMNTHSLEDWGEFLHYKKGEFDDWSRISEEMITYCKRDVALTLAIFKRFEKVLNDPVWQSSIECEHKMLSICYEMKQNGLSFRKDKAQEVLSEIQERIAVLEKKFQEIWPPVLICVGSVQYRVKKDGNLFVTTQNAIERYPKTEIRSDGRLYLYDWVEFNPGSPKDRIDKLWEAGWKPVEKTKTHQKWAMRARVGQRWGKNVLTPTEFQKKKEYFDYYGWTVSEENLNTLPEDAPEGAKALSEWLCLTGRERALIERIEACGDDGKIHPTFWFIGSWTHRMAHTSPNVANISAPFNGEVKTTVDEIKEKYDSQLREMFYVENGHLIGTDAQGIQLRILAHYLQNDDYIHAIVEGRKEDETDIHNINRRALGLSHITRDDAKTFVYAWLLGAGSGKVSRILGCSVSVAKEAMDSFVENTKGLRDLKSGRIPRDAGRGYFVGLDGRRVPQRDSYLMLAGYLQNGEACVMKHANILWREWAIKEGIQFKQVNFVHDEWQTETFGSLDEAERLGYLQRLAIEEIGKRLNCYCPLAGESKIGQNWLETH